MAIDLKGSVGCAYYVASEETLYLQEDIPLAGLELVETLLLHAQPTTVIVSGRANDVLVEYLERNSQDLADGPRSNGQFYTLADLNCR